MTRWRKNNTENDQWINLGRGVGTRALYAGGKPGIAGEIIHIRAVKLPN